MPTFSGLPANRAPRTFASFDLSRNEAMRPAYERCRQVATGEAWCALLAGTPGTGKSHLAEAAMREHGMLRSHWWKVPSFLDWLRSRYSADVNGASVSDLVRTYETTEALLVFDDLGTEKQTEWAYEQLYRILDNRYELELPTIITTNNLKSVDERIMSRYACGLVVCKGPDQRRAGK